ncbi:hypothetical protein F5148DRAFT_1232964 [Russula earlei]|uniref:Uncharacterized protein n=1 Tax=Russula earlei TaxID=71964 RepID=A0ACC0TZT5_9AGAM|nr:hypothetical protein F5148DRAFT_1232964 [Russula earlei]
MRYIAAYAAGVLHRDLSPGNIMIFRDEDNALNIRYGMLVDWDLSKAVDQKNEHTAAHQDSRTGS